VIIFNILWNCYNVKKKLDQWCDGSVTGVGSCEVACVK